MITLKMNAVFTKFKFLVKEIPKPLGRWRLEHSMKQLNHKIDLANQDHCGPCGQHADVKINTIKIENTLFHDKITLVANTLVQ